MGERDTFSSAHKSKPTAVDSLRRVLQDVEALEGHLRSSIFSSACDYSPEQSPRKSQEAPSFSTHATLQTDNAAQPSSNNLPPLAFEQSPRRQQPAAAPPKFSCQWSPRTWAWSCDSAHSYNRAFQATSCASCAACSGVHSCASCQEFAYSATTRPPFENTHFEPIMTHTPRTIRSAPSAPRSPTKPRRDVDPSPCIGGHAAPLVAPSKLAPIVDADEIAKLLRPSSLDLLQLVEDQIPLPPPAAPLPPHRLIEPSAPPRRRQRASRLLLSSGVGHANGDTGKTYYNPETNLLIVGRHVLPRMR